MPKGTPENNYDVIEAHMRLFEVIGEFRGEYLCVNLDYLMGIQDYCRDKIELAKLRLEANGNTPYEKVAEVCGRKTSIF